MSILKFSMRVFTSFLLLSVFSFETYASRARSQALASSFHLLDSTQTYNNPLYAFYMPNQVVFEPGLTTPTSQTNNAEVFGLYELPSENRILLSLGHVPQLVYEGRQFINSAASLNYSQAQNPLRLGYLFKTSDLSHAVVTDFSQLNNKVTGQSEKSFVLGYGLEMGRWHFVTEVVAQNDAELAGGLRFNGAGSFKVGVYYGADTTHFFFTYGRSQLKSYLDDKLRESHHVQNFAFALVDSSLREENEFFWGLQVKSVKTDCLDTAAALTCQQSANRVTLPVWFGVETQAASFLKLRASFTQTALFNIQKDSVGYPALAFEGGEGAVTEYTSGPNSTAVAMGLGWMLGPRLTLDGLLGAAGSQIINMTNFLSQVSLTYDY
jgi:hypothetical protein